MPQIRRILVPVDFSPSSAHAVEVAATFAARFSATIHLLHVVDLPLYAPPGQPLIASAPAQQSLDKFMLERARDEMTTFRGSLSAEVGELIETELVENGLPRERIIEVAEQGNYDLIVMGTVGRTGLRRVMLGSVAERVLRHAPCPIVTTKLPHAE